MTRASTGVLINGLTANGNGRDGIELNGGPLAGGPNAAGAPVASYGNNALSNSTADGNARYGINVLGGNGVKVDGNTVRNNTMGIVVGKAALSISITGDTIDNSTKHAIALIGSASKTTISKNSINGADIGIYLRDSSGTVEGNRLTNVSTHGITLIGATGGSSVMRNTVSGAGPTAVDTARATGVIVQGNTTTGWTNTKPLAVILGQIFQPLTVLWMILGLIVLISALSGIGRRHSGFRNPYADQVPLSTLTKGVIQPEELGLASYAHGAARTSRPASPIRGTRPSVSIAKRKRELHVRSEGR